MAVSSDPSCGYGIVRNRPCSEQSLHVMYMEFAFKYIDDIMATKGSDSMTTATKRTHKHFQLDSAKIKRAQRALRAKTETEAIERALDFAIEEHEKNRLVLLATERFIKSGIEIKDIYGTLVG